MILTSKFAVKSIAVVLTFSMCNFSVPMGIPALVMGMPSKKLDPISLPTGKEAAPKVSRALRVSEMDKLQGKLAVCPYVAGAMKWNVAYRGVDLMTGNYSTSATDLTFEGGYGIPVNVTRSYSSNNGDEGPLGVGWTLSVDVRTTAGGLMKSGGAPYRGVPVAFGEKSTGEKFDPNKIVNLHGNNGGGGQAGPAPTATDPVEAVVVQDASGESETIQRDVDGVLTPPAWDSNVIDTTYETIIQGGNTYQIMTSNTVKTVDGTTYAYTKHGIYGSRNPNSGGVMPYYYDVNNAPPAEPSNILKIDTATDRHGNTTNYIYSGTATFGKMNGSTTEDKLIRVEMPNGHKIEFTWGTGGNVNRMVAASADNVRTVEFTYSTAGNLISAKTPAGYTTTYEYGSAAPLLDANNQVIGETAGNLLTKITNPQGLSETIAYQTGIVSLLPSGYPVQAPMVQKLTHANSTSTLYYYRGNLMNEFVTSWFNINEEFDAYVANGFIDVIGTSNPSQNDIINGGLAEAQTDFTAKSLTVNLYPIPHDVYYQASSATVAKRHQPMSTAVYDMESQNALWSRDLIYPGARDAGLQGANPQPTTFNLGYLRGLNDLPNVIQFMESECTYNFKGEPLNKIAREGYKTYTSSTPTYVRVWETSTAYWGADKYYQQKATRSRGTFNGSTSAWRYSFTDYYDANSAQGSKGQTYRVYDPKYGGISLNTSATVPSYAPTGDVWKYQVQATGTHSATMVYDSKGRPTDVYKLQKFVSGTPQYVQTHTTYGADQSPKWGQADVVVEDYGGLNRTTTNMSYDSAGRVIEVKDALNRKFKTVYDLDGRVQMVTRSDLSSNAACVSYTYGTSGIENGQPTTIQDGSSGIKQDIFYVNSGVAIGQPSSIHEYVPPLQGSGYGRDYWATYAYNAYGDRDTVIYSTPNGESSYRYLDYVRVGSPLKGARVFQTMQEQVKSGSNWVAGKDEFHYAYDSSGRMLASAFAQTPSLTSATSTGRGYSSYYGLGSSGPVSRVRSDATLDSAGRTQELAYHFQTSSGMEAITSNVASYASPLGLKTASQHYVKDPNDAQSYILNRSESYGYDADRDYLTSCTMSGSTRTWTYDPAGNRTGDSGNAGTWTYDNLNRMTASPGQTYTYDAVGNMTGRSVNTSGGGNNNARIMTWDWTSNRMLSCSTQASGARYEYRADGMRALKFEGLTLSWQYLREEDQRNQGSGFYDQISGWNMPTTRYYYDGQMGFEEDRSHFVGSFGPNIDCDVTANAIGARGIDRIQKYVRSSTDWGMSWTRSASSSDVFVYPLYDAHGNMVRTLSKTSSGGYTVSAETVVDPWGTKVSSGTGEKRDYCASIGHVTDDESGLVYMRARYYEPGMGRFVSEDPVVEGENWYVYCDSSPSLSCDPSGKWLFPEESLMNAWRIFQSAENWGYGTLETARRLQALKRQLLAYARCQKALGEALIREGEAEQEVAACMGGASIMEQKIGEITQGIGSMKLGTGVAAQLSAACIDIMIELLKGRSIEPWDYFSR